MLPQLTLLLQARSLAASTDLCNGQQTRSLHIPAGSSQLHISNDLWHTGDGTSLAMQPRFSFIAVTDSQADLEPLSSQWTAVVKDGGVYVK